MIHVYPFAYIFLHIYPNNMKLISLQTKLNNEFQRNNDPKSKAEHEISELKSTSGWPRNRAVLRLLSENHAVYYALSNLSYA